MKKIVFLIAIVLLVAAGASAERVTLTAPEVLTPRETNNLLWYVTMIDGYTKRLEVTYYYLDQNGKVIPHRNKTGANTWECINDENDDPNTPYDDTVCFDSIFKFQMRQQDVGAFIGVGLRTLIWNKFKTSLRTTNNDGTFLNAE